MFFLPAIDSDTPDLVISAGDIVGASEREYGAMRALDALTGRIDTESAPADEMTVLVTALGHQHEQEVLASFRPRGVYEVVPGGKLTRGTLTARHDETLWALVGGHGAVYQGSFFDGTFHGRADFLLREPDGTWSVNDTKLSRSPKTSALLRLAAYADQLAAAGVPVHQVARLILGTGEVTAHPLAEILPRYRGARARLEALAAEHLDEDEAAAWGDRRWSVCLKCDVCRAGIEVNDDLMLVRRMNPARRARLIASGSETMHGFAEDTFAKAENFLGDLHEQAKLQTGIGPSDGEMGGTAFTGYTAHDRRKVFPDLHVYHYANYEVTALRKLAARHQVMAAEVEELVEAGVLFDVRDGEDVPAALVPIAEHQEVGVALHARIPDRLQRPLRSPHAHSVSAVSRPIRGGGQPAVVQRR